MRSVLVVQMAGDDVVHVSPVRHRFVSAGCRMRVRFVMPATIVAACTVRGILRVDREFVLVDVSLVRIMQMAVVNIIGVVVVLYRRMTAAAAVGVVVLFMNCMSHTPYVSQGNKKCTLFASLFQIS